MGDTGLEVSPISIRRTTISETLCAHCAHFETAVPGRMIRSIICRCSDASRRSEMDAKHQVALRIARNDLTKRLTHPLLSSASFLGRSLPNRTVVAPMSRVSAAEGGLATQRMQRYYAAFARGGFAVVITEGTYTDTDASQGYDRQPGMATPAQAEAWRPVANEIRAAGAVAIMQLMHAGGLSQRTPVIGRTIAPSRIQPRGQMMPEYGGSGPYPVQLAMTKDDIRSVRDGFARAARRARNVGFDGIEIHAANGYLLDQFNTTYTNPRTDRYGGPPEKRIRLTAEIVETIRSAAPNDFIVGVRVSEAKVNDFYYRWPGGPERSSARSPPPARAISTWRGRDAASAMRSKARRSRSQRTLGG